VLDPLPGFVSAVEGDDPPFPRGVEGARAPTGAESPPPPPCEETLPDPLPPELPRGTARCAAAGEEAASATAKAAIKAQPSGVESFIVVPRVLPPLWHRFLVAPHRPEQSHCQPDRNQSHEKLQRM